MSIANHIIIPIVGSRQNLDENILVTPRPLILTPRKDEDLPENILWKKSMSAFKKFKQRKQRRDKKLTSEGLGEDVNLNDLKKQRLYLTQFKFQACLSFRSQNDTGQVAEEVQYFDPNEAPLFQFNSLETNIESEKSLKLVNKFSRLISQNFQKKSQKQFEQLIQQEVFISPKFEEREDDPFIIIRKQNGKKGNKNLKIKMIKKQKNKSKQKLSSGLFHSCKKDDHGNLGQSRINARCVSLDNNNSSDMSSEQQKDSSEKHKEIQSLKDLLFRDAQLRRNQEQSILFKRQSSTISKNLEKNDYVCKQ